MSLHRENIDIRGDMNSTSTRRQINNPKDAVQICTPACHGRSAFCNHKLNETLCVEQKQRWEKQLFKKGEQRAELNNPKETSTSYSSLQSDNSYQPVDVE